MYLSTGSLTVTDTPDVLDSVQEIVNKRNNEMSRQVVLNVEILSIKKSSQNRRESTGTQYLMMVILV